MTNPLRSTLFAVTSGATFALSAGAVPAAPGTCPTTAVVNVNARQVELPADAAAQVTMLQQHGARYERVIDLILEENAKPEWTFAEHCIP